MLHQRDWLETLRVDTRSSITNLVIDWFIK
jgi:hypothetical protein